MQATPGRRAGARGLALALTSATLLACDAETDKADAPALGVATISATVRTARGGAPELAHIELVEYPGRVPMESVEVGPDGRVVLEAPVATPLTLRVAAVDHEPCGLQVIFEEDTGPVGLDVTLAAYEWREQLDRVAVLGEWHGWDFGKAEPMTAEGGLYVWEGSVPAGRVSYQLSNLVPYRSVRGPRRGPRGCGGGPARWRSAGPGSPRAPGTRR